MNIKPGTDCKSHWNDIEKSHIHILNYTMVIFKVGKLLDRALNGQQTKT